MSNAQPSKARTITELIEILLGAHALCYYYPGAMPFVQGHLVKLSQDIAHTVMSSIRTTPNVPYIPWSPRSMDPGRAGLVISPRNGPLLSGPFAPLGPGAVTPPRRDISDSDVSMPQASEDCAPPHQSDARGRPS